MHLEPWTSLMNSLLRFASICLSVVAVGLPLAAAEVSKKAIVPQGTYVAADMSAYGCARLPNAVERRTLHIGQIIEGTYYEWQQSYVSTAADEPVPYHLACISLLKPDARSLDRTSAMDFLRRSSGVGEPAVTAKAAAVDTAKEQATSNFSPADVQAEPAKRVLQPNNDSEVQSRAVAPEPSTSAPPTPAEHRPAEDDASAPVAKSAVRKPQARALSAQALAAADPRTVLPATATTTFPYKTIGYLVVTYPNGERYRCTGVLVSVYVVLTAGHCIHNNDRGGWARSVEFYPAMYQEAVGAPVYRPYPPNTDVANLKATQEWTQMSGPDSFLVTQYRYDFAAIQFRTPFTYTSTFMPIVFNETTTQASTAGYPANLSGVSQTVYGMYAATGPETPSSTNSLRPRDVREFSLTSSGGDSGSPFYSVGGAGLYYALTGSLSYGNDDNTQAGGPWYDNWNRDLLTSWMTWTPGSASNASPPPTAPTVSLTAPTSLSQTTLSFLRFYNQGTISGTVTVKLANGATGQSLYTWTSPTIPSGAVLQQGLADIEYLIPATLRTTTYSISLQSSFNGYLQHVLWSPSVGALSNLSICNTSATSDPKVLIDVHSSRVGGYPSYVVAHNTGTATASVNLGIYDSRTGTRLGGYVLGNIPANGQARIAMTSIENGAGIYPAVDVPHYVVKVEGSFIGYLQHVVNNTAANVWMDMSVMCGLTAY
jgi:V8-like Glu-specific endopeptidase